MKAAVIDDPARLIGVMGQAYVTGDYRIHGLFRTTLMRYFFSTTLAATPLPLGIIQAAAAAGLVFFSGPL
jgi:predicted cation transporter